MGYPQAPWTLKGYAFLSLHLVEIAKASPFIPVELAIVPSLPGKTLGGVYLSQYTKGDLTYNELIVVAGLVSWQGTIGAWVSHIYVDNPDSVAGGREIWGLPKEMAEFRWESGESGSVTVRQGDQLLCAMRSTGRFSLLRQRFSFPGFSQQDGRFLVFNSTAQANFGLVGVNLDIPQSSPFGRLINSPPVMAVSADSLDLKVDAPKIVGK
ncbi:acetoacetate decarboxylase family protein [Phormidesmis sp. 146-33]